MILSQHAYVFSLFSKMSQTTTQMIQYSSAKNVNSKGYVLTMMIYASEW